jgi:DNA-binding response OmpR family regulator
MCIYNIFDFVLMDLQMPVMDGIHIYVYIYKYDMYVCIYKDMICMCAFIKI